MTSSSDFGSDYKAYHGRLENSKYWATAGASPSDPWIEVDLLTIQTIFGIRTQGSSLSSADEYVKTLNVAYGESSASSYILNDDGEIKVGITIE